MMLNYLNTMGLRTDVVTLPHFEDVDFAKQLHDGAIMMRRHFAGLLSKGRKYNRKVLQELSEDAAYNLARIRNLDTRLAILETCYANYEYSLNEIFQALRGVDMSEDNTMNAIRSVRAAFIYLDECENGKEAA